MKDSIDVSNISYIKVDWEVVSSSGERSINGYVYASPSFQTNGFPNQDVKVSYDSISNGRRTTTLNVSSLTSNQRIGVSVEVSNTKNYPSIKARIYKVWVD